MDHVSLAIVHVVVNEPQALNRSEKRKITHFQREQLLIFARVQGRIQYQRPETLPTGLSYLIDTELPVTWRGRSSLCTGSYQSGLFHLSEQGIEPPMTDARIWTDNVVDDTGYEVAVGRTFHQLRQYEKLVHAHILSAVPAQHISS